jgi:hypothetical protein
VVDNFHKDPILILFQSNSQIKNSHVFTFAKNWAKNYLPNSPKSKNQS